MPLELFVLVGTFIEELISPIPSFLVLIPAGAAAHAQESPLIYVLLLALFSGLGRITGASILYWLADKIEDLVLGNGRRFFGVSHDEVERFGQRLGRSRKRDWLLLFLMNALPFFPGAALSLTCGFVKVRFTMFIVCTFFGTMVNALTYLTIGYAGLAVLDTVRDVQLIAQITTGVVVFVVVILLIRRRKRHKQIEMHIS